MQPVVAFAGEHCHPSFYSTVHGAYLSGRTAAQFMLNAAAKSKEADDDEGQLGQGDCDDRAEPAAVPLPAGFEAVDVACGDEFTLLVGAGSW